MYITLGQEHMEYILDVTENFFFNHLLCVLSRPLYAMFIIASYTDNITSTMKYHDLW